MAVTHIYFQTNIPNELVSSIADSCSKYEHAIQKSDVLLNFRENNTIQGNDEKARNSTQAWIPTEEWIAPFLWYYISRANRHNFLYDILTIDTETMQYTVYEEGMYYHWHCDNHLNYMFTPQNPPSPLQNDAQQLAMEKAEYCRKLSFSLQLSDPSEYTGGELQFHEGGKSAFAPKEKGSLVIFDSRIYHRVKPVKSGVRKSLVGWVLGPRWK